MHSGKFPLWETLGGETCYEAATRETRMVLFGAVRELLEKTGIAIPLNDGRLGLPGNLLLSYAVLKRIHGL